MTNAIEVRALRKSFGRTQALDGLDLTVRTGEVHAFLGPNGAGKTTTIRILLGLLRQDGGEASLLGGDPWRDAVRLHARLAYVPGDVTLWPSLTGGEIIDLLSRLRGPQSAIDAKRKDALIERFALDPAKKARAYSKGNRQKVALIAALASDAELLVFDEPTAGLDPLMEATFRECVDDERHRGRTVLLSSHILAEAEALSDRVTIIRDGRTAETGTLAEMRHLTRTTVDAELAGPVSLDGLRRRPRGGHPRHPAALRGGHRRAERRAGPPHRGRRPVPGVPATDPGRAVPSSLFNRTDRAGSPGMTVIAGTGALARLAFRRDRIMLPAWVYLITALVASSSYSLNKLYPTAQARAALAVSGGRNPALVFLYGRLSGDSLGAVSAWRYGVWAAIFGALMSIFLVIRHTRADEETGRLELVGSAAVGRLGGLTAALLTAVAASVVLALLLAVALIVVGLPAAGSAAFALAIATCSLAFAAVAALTAQLAAGARAARGIAAGVLGAAYLLRAVGDAAGSSGPSWLTWLSPLGWTEFVRPYTADRWWVLALPLALTAVGRRRRVRAGRDPRLRAGLLPDRPGRATASGWLRGPRCWPPLGLAWRLQRGTLLGWAAGFAFTFAASGAAAKGIGSLLGGSAQLRQEFTRLGGQAGITDAYLAAIMSLAGLAAAAYATSAVLRVRAEETEGRAELLLATATGRIRWGLSHVLVAVFGAALLLAVAGLAAGLGYGLRTSSAGPEVARLLGAAAAQLPASLAAAAIAVMLLGLAPRAAVAAAWTVVGAVVVIALFGQVLRLSQWVLDISPFTHVPKLPGGAVSAAPLLWLSLAAAGVLRRRPGRPPPPRHRLTSGNEALMHDFTRCNSPVRAHLAAGLRNSRRRDRHGPRIRPADGRIRRSGQQIRNEIVRRAPSTPRSSPATQDPTPAHANADGDRSTVTRNVWPGNRLFAAANFGITV